VSRWHWHRGGEARCRRGGARHWHRGEGARHRRGGGARHRHGGAREGCGGGCAVVADAEEGARWKADAEEEQAPAGVGEMTGLGFGGSGALKKKNSSDDVDDIINTYRYK
jgi:hypothetical protein